jgi:hypothetical protein
MKFLGDSLGETAIDGRYPVPTSLDLTLIPMAYPIMSFSRSGVLFIDWSYERLG